MKTECTQGAEGQVHKDNCYVNDVTYDCGKDIVVRQPTAVTGYKCAGGIACRGTECIDADYQVNTNFARVQALMNSVQNIQQDMKCTGLDENGKPLENEDINCKVFTGTAGWCKKAGGGVQNCCKPVPGVGLFDYLTAFYNVMNLTSADKGLMGQINVTTQGDALTSITGSFAELARKGESAMSGWFSGFSETFSKFTSNFTGMLKEATDVFEPALKTLQNIRTTVTDTVRNALKTVLEKAGVNFGQPAAGTATSEGINKMTEETTNQAASNLLAGGAAVMSVISWAYTAYTMFRLAVSMIYKCEDQEYEMFSKREIGSCHQSPLSRILNEQIKAQGVGEDGGSWGEPKNPRCGGVDLRDLDQVNWDRVDLSEWTSMLAANHLLASMKDMTFATTTGAESKLGEISRKLGYERADAVGRTLDRVGDSDLDYNRQKQAQSLQFSTGAPQDGRKKSPESQ